MTVVTHGTRSAYNKGCRCEACREASRLARARQRAAASDRAVDAAVGVTMSARWVLVVGLAVAGGASLSHARRLREAASGSMEPYWRWILAGAVFLTMAAGITESIIPPASQD